MNTDTAEPAKTLGQVAFEAFYQKDSRLLEWHDRHEDFKSSWEIAAQAVLQQFLSVGPVSAEDFKKALDVTHLITKDWDALERLNQTLRARHANPVQAEGGEVEKWKANYVEVHDQLTASQARVARVEAGNKSMLKAIAIRDKELAQADEATAKYRQVWQETEARLNDARDQCRKVTADLEAMKVRAEKEHSEQLHLISLREKQLMETSESVDEFQKENAALSAQSAEHVRQITMDAGTIKRLQDVGFESDLKVQELEKEITALRQERDRSDQDWANAKKECESLRFRLTESNRVLAHTELSQVTEQRDKALAELGEERAWTGKQKAELQEANGIIAQLRSRSGVLSSQQVKTAITIVAGNLTNRRNGIMEHGYGMIAEKLNASLQPPWRTIIAGDPASPNDYVLFGGGGMDFVAGQFRDRHEARTHYMPIPPLPTPKVSEGDEPTFLEWWQHVWNTPDYQKLSSSAAEKIWQAARTSQAVEEKAL